MQNDIDIKVYVLSSSDSIKDIRNKLTEIHKPIMANVMLKWDKSNKTLIETKDKNIIMYEEQYMNKFKETYTDYKIENYDWTTFPYPKQEDDETTNLHIKQIPNTYTQDEAMKYIQTSLQDILRVNEYKINIPLKNRSDATIHGYAKIIFNDNISAYKRYLSKIKLHHSEILCNKTNRLNTIQAIWHKNKTLTGRNNIRTKQIPISHPIFIDTKIDEECLIPML